MKLQILVPQYNETDSVIKPLLDSIAIQQNINFDDIGVIICNDGSDVFLTNQLLTAYPFMIEYYKEPKRGVSGTRNACLDKATADYVMFCDADDMFYNACGLWILFREMEHGGFDTLVSTFTEETRDFVTNEIIYINHDIDSTFVHGKVHRRKYLIDNNIRWNESLTIHEDSYFNILCQTLAKNGKYCNVPFYLWKWRDGSVCRHDKKYILKTYNNMLDSNTALIHQLVDRGYRRKAQEYVTSVIYDAYFTMNKDEWLNQDNQAYRMDTEKRFKQYYSEFKPLYLGLEVSSRNQIIASIKNRMYTEGMIMESVTFHDWINHICNL